ncbi:PLDc_N domain-containing protein [Microbacterium bovistercoris]|uniref:PLDc_N domain-containing protein n=1 Tax=Microbacterium bovistercoris TaxID=2293570 RepID=A0A371NRH2_9MICO|nr:PLD nuclease N-terminal domain-containing protein [Microbacterium bovistercoris]REJ04235.1 PLDc_N domain-containing protein [Microbacterium bovistercoris]
MPLFSILVIALTVVALIDIITRDDSQVKHMPKFVWLLLVVFLPLIGGILWFAVGREYPEGGIRLGRERRERPARREPSAPAAPVRPVDTRSTEQQIADLDREIEEWRLREEIAKRKKDGPAAGSGTGASEA